MNFNHGKDLICNKRMYILYLYLYIYIYIYTHIYIYIYMYAMKVGAVKRLSWE